tara:strand:- start:4459 stop:4791 length:333 start_codon:yes stop_codon:yes gene_type:complete
MNSINMMVGKLAYSDSDYEGDVAMSQCLRGVQRLGVEWDEVKSKSRKRRIVDARRLCCSHLRAKGWTFERIAEAVGYTNHATAIHHVNVVQELIDYDKNFKDKYLKFMHA